jgi:hypothetical protein
MIRSPRAVSYPRTYELRIDFYAFDRITGVKEMTAALDGTPVLNKQKIDLHTLAVGDHTLVVTAVDYAGNTATKSVTFKVVVTIQTLKSSVEHFYKDGSIDSRTVYNYLMGSLAGAERKHKPADVIDSLNFFIAKVQQQSGTHIKTEAANQLIAEAQWLINNLK